MSAVPAFELPTDLVASAPPETRGVPRDRVRLLVAEPDRLRHRVAAALPSMLHPGDVLVVNTSDTLPASLHGVTEAGERVEVHLSTLDPASGADYPDALRRPASRWVVEVRTPGPYGGEPSRTPRDGTTIRLLGGGVLTVDTGYTGASTARTEQPRLWTARLDAPGPLGAWLSEVGDPIRYRYVRAPWPLSAYRTPYADTPGSVEMPSAGRALTAPLLRRLRARGVTVASLVLHCGVSSLESGDPPYPEWYEVPTSTADAVRAAKADRRRVVAVGTTVVRALESAAEVGAGTVRATRGWTDLVVTPDRGVDVVDGLLTGWHEPEASHLDLLTAVAGTELVRESYAEALRVGYRWHEFGDLHLLLPR